MEAFSEFVGRQLDDVSTLAALVDDDTGCSEHSNHARHAKQLRPPHERLRYATMPETMTLHDAVAEAATGDVWLFRGPSVADRAIRLFTNSPVNHVGVVLAIDDLPPLIWHAELGASMPNIWTGQRSRGAQLHYLDRAVSIWTHRYGQQPWFRQINIEATDEMENEALAVVAEYSGRAFPSAPSLAKHWVAGRLRRQTSLTDIYCAELVAVTFEQMGLLGNERPPNWYDPGRFWSGDRLELVGAELGSEVEVTDVGPIADSWRDG